LWEVAVAEVVRESALDHSDGNAWFFTETSLDQLLAGTRPVRSIEDLALEDLTPEEASAFLQAIEE
jgi:hypothetical protein